MNYKKILLQEIKSGKRDFNQLQNFFEFKYGSKFKRRYGIIKVPKHDLKHKDQYIEKYIAVYSALIIDTVYDLKNEGLVDVNISENSPKPYCQYSKRNHRIVRFDRAFITPEGEKYLKEHTIWGFVKNIILIVVKFLFSILKLVKMVIF